MHPPFETTPTLAALPGIHHGFFGRAGGVSDGDFASLNASRFVGDDLANVTENVHRAVMALRNGPLPIALAKQVHGVEVALVEDDYDLANRPEADALVTRRVGIALGILTADCVPVLLADRDAGVIGAVHAGWKGATGEVLARTVETMRSLGARPERVSAAIGPAISAANYEIGEDMAAQIADQFPDAVPFILTKGVKKPHFDVPGLVENQARALGIGAIETLPICTYAHPDRYFSHRFATHAGIAAGRQIALIART